MHAIPMATNPNGTLLLSWLVDTSALPGRYRPLASRLAPAISHLACHKLASGTILRLVQQRVDPAAADIIVGAIFAADNVVLDILSDSVGHSAAHIVIHSSIRSFMALPSSCACCQR